MKDKHNKEKHKWETQVFERDNHICVCCGSKRNIVAHIVKSKSEKLVYKKSNGVTLCKKCYTEFHNDYLFCNTKKQFEEFLHNYHCGPLEIKRETKLYKKIKGEIVKVKRDAIIKKRFILLSMDPGKNNFAYAFLTYEGELIRYGLIKDTITDLKGSYELNYSVRNFSNTFECIVDEYKNKNMLCIMERFMFRRGVRGALDEIVNIMLGLVIGSLNCKYILTPAAAWKNFYGRKEIEYGNPKLVEHTNDAIFLGLWQLQRMFNWNIIKLRRKVREINSMKDIRKLEDKNISFKQLIRLQKEV